MASLTRTFAIEAQEITRAWNQATSELHNALQRYISIGETLHRVKQGLEHGEFEHWVKTTLPFSLRKAEQCMAFALRSSALDSPDSDRLTELWQEVKHALPKTNDRALLTIEQPYIGGLPAPEIEDLKHSEGGIEPEEEQAQVPEPAEVTPRATRKRGRPDTSAEVKASPIATESTSDADGVTIPSQLLSIFATVEQFEHLASEVGLFRVRLEDAVGANPEAWSSLDHQRMLADLSLMRQQFLEARPYLICPVCGGEDPDKTCTMCNGHCWLSRFRARTVAIELRNPQRKIHGLALLTGNSQKKGEETQ